ncbi:hypothetical protein CAPTEDRAFT_193877 [Capitella teleta]|uniref:PID domain-containing protein n=1 Tax=Capitella teleta TaxID=283909 RepID=R7V538_CAPTE|nr:hypothetical protein CAPTEDRAFT_193877 [Capitella teleta]|eukprot:ELU11471.1 hypothetical protein CAPTEDRAFT_193877 [Capitella teleta]
MFFKRQSRRACDAFAMGSGVSSDNIEHTERLVLSPIMHGYRSTYLGSVPTESANDPTETSLCVERILDACNIREKNMRGAFISFRPQHMLLHIVDSVDHVIKTRYFDLARIAVCSAGLYGGSPCIFTWNYQQETDYGFQLECHAVKVNSAKRARQLASLLGSAFHQMSHDFHAAMRSSHLFQAAFDRKEPSTDLHGDLGDDCFSDDHQLLLSHA